MLPRDLPSLVTLGPPTLSPDGRHAVVAVTRPDVEADEYRSALWLVPTDGSAPPRRLTQGPHDTAPRYSPDGSQLAFLRAADGARPQLHLLPTAGGDARRLTDLHLGAGAPVWSPDSTRIAFTARVPEPGRYGQDESVPAEKEPPRRVTGLTYRVDGVGFLRDRPSHVFVVDVTVEDASATPVTEGLFDDTDVAWTPDGTELLFAAARHAGHDDDVRSDVHAVRPDGSGLRTLTDTSLAFASTPVVTADGAVLLSALDRPDDPLCRNTGLFTVPLDAAGATPRRLTDEESVHLADSRPVVDGEGVLALVEHRGTVEVRRFGTDGTDGTDGTGTRVTSGRRVVSGVDRVGGVTVVTYADPSSPGELGLVDGDTVRPLTEFGADARAVSVGLQELTASAPDGHEVHGFVAVPEGDGPHPVLLMIHGGPFAQYTWALFDEAQVYAGAGYAVVYGNPRGSSGYGQAHGRHIIGDVGERSAADLLALLDAALTRPDLDADRVGVLGGSHGGYMTTWLLGHSDRFRAAVSERAVNALDSFEGSSDIGWHFADQLYGTDPGQRHRQSPLTTADAIATPLLIVHSEQDWRCPLEQAQRLFVSLRRRGATVEMLLFPGEGHELSRSGTPKHRVARFDAILEWFGRHL